MFVEGVGRRRAVRGGGARSALRHLLPTTTLVCTPVTLTVATTATAEPSAALFHIRQERGGKESVSQGLEGPSRLVKG